MNKISILIVEDEEVQGQLITEILTENNHQCHWVDSAEAALEAVNKNTYHIVLSDWRLPQNDGLWLLEQLNQKNDKPYFVLATAYGSIQHAVKAIKTGASDYLTKPYSRDQLLFCIDRAAQTISLTQENKQLNSQLNQQIQERKQLVDMVGSSKPMQTMFNQVIKLAPTNATIHISGESGTGKELAARALHQLSPRKDKPFIVINCGAIPEGLAEAELFGAEKGAYTGSHTRKIGSFEAANGGTIFLDEVAELTPSIQTKLLRVLQESTITRVGSNQPLKIAVRIISATHKSLTKLVEDGSFREDLLYRLNVIPIKMPALRERIEDLPALLHFFNQKHANSHQLEPLSLSKSAIQEMESYYWPGNIRELSHCVERLLLLSEGAQVNKADLLFLTESKEPTKVLTLPKQGINWQSMEQSFYKQALEATKGNKKKAAKLLGLSYKSFLYRLEKFLISD